jgi:lysozyme family protein
MKGDYDLCLKQILHHEGGFVHNPHDPGGMTNLGVTKAVWEAYVGHKVDEAAMRALTPEVVGPLYKKNYWDKLHCDDLPGGLDLCAFDFAVNGGPGRSAKFVQRLVGAHEDGAIGPGTIAKVNEYVAQHGAPAALKAFQELRRAYYRSLPTFGTFGKGWLRRVDEVEATALTMA